MLPYSIRNISTRTYTLMNAELPTLTVQR